MNYYNRKLPSLNEECGVIGVINLNEASYYLYLGLHALQHRGQEASGIVTLSEDNKIVAVKRAGSIVNTFQKEDIVRLKGNIGIGHVRYSTYGGSSSINIQPFVFTLKHTSYATCHNGNIVNADRLRSILEKQGSIFFSFSDSEILGHFLNISRKSTTIGKLKESLAVMEGAFSFVIFKDECLYGCRDKNGLRPLVLGKKDNGYIIASETVALDIIGAAFVRDIEPGEIIEINKHNHITSTFYCANKQIQHTMCAMEYIYFSRPDTVLEGKNVYNIRRALGKILAIEQPVAADIVIGIPDSSVPYAMGYSEQSGIPYEIGLIKNKYIGRSFIAPNQEEREKILKMKLNVNRAVIKDKRIILVDDSIVRGTTMLAIIYLLHEAGAKEIHIRVGAPKIISPCFYGVDTSEITQLALHTHSKAEFLKKLKYATSLEFISLEGLQIGIGRRGGEAKNLCLGCFTKKYPTELFDNAKKLRSPIRRNTKKG